MNLYKFLLLNLAIVTLISCNSQGQMNEVRVSASPASVGAPTPNYSQESAARITPPQIEDQDPCGSAVTQLELNDCAAREFKEADAELNRFYDRIMSTLDGRDKGNLREAQRAWVRYRDTNCLAESHYKGGSISPMIHSFCLGRNTADRIKELKIIYESDNN